MTNVPALEQTPKNFTGIVFAEHEAGYLVGYLAGLTAKRQGGRQVISAVGANHVPAIVKFISGYIQGAKKANPRIKVIANYANDPTFSDQAKCKKIGAAADRPGLAGGLPGRRRLWSRRASPRRRRTCGGSASTPISATSARTC